MGNFGTATSRRIRLLAAVKSSAIHLACHQASPASGRPKHVRPTGVNVADQLGALVLGTIKESELCIPSLETLP